MSTFISPLRVTCGFRLDDGLGRDRKSRANRQRAVFGDAASHRVNPGRRDDLLDSPSLRVGRGWASVSPSHEASRARSAQLRDAKTPTLGLLDELGNRADRSARRLASGPKAANTGNIPTNPDDFFSEKAFAAAARWKQFADSEFDVFESPRGRARKGEERTEVQNVKSNIAATSPRHQRAVLGILTGPSSRLGRAARASMAMNSTAQATETKGQPSNPSAGKTSVPLLGILSGPGKRLGRNRKRS